LFSSAIDAWRALIPLSRVLSTYPVYRRHRCSRTPQKPRFHFHFDSDFVVHSPHNYGPCQNGQKSPCCTVLFLHFFQKVLPRKPRRGTRALRAFHFPASSCGHPAVPFPSWDLSEKHSSLEPGPRKRKGEVFTLRLPCPGSHGQRRESPFWTGPKSPPGERSDFMGYSRDKRPALCKWSSR
jgi:hypothetical protein